MGVRQANQRVNKPESGWEGEITHQPDSLFYGPKEKGCGAGNRCNRCQREAPERELGHSSCYLTLAAARLWCDTSAVGSWGINLKHHSGRLPTCAWISSLIPVT